MTFASRVNASWFKNVVLENKTKILNKNISFCSFLPAKLHSKVSLNHWNMLRIMFRWKPSILKYNLHISCWEKRNVQHISSFSLVSCYTENLKICLLKLALNNLNEFSVSLSSDEDHWAVVMRSVFNTPRGIQIWINLTAVFIKH